MKEILRAMKTIWKHGVVVWAQVVQANARMYAPGPEDCPGTVIFSATEPDEIAFASLPKLTGKLHDLLDHESPGAHWTKRETEWWEDLHNDGSYHRGYKLPEEWQTTAKDYKGSSVLFHRAHLPGGIIQSRILPILVDPIACVAQVLPASYWPAGMADWLRTSQSPHDDEGESQPPSFESTVESLATDRVDREKREAIYTLVFGPIVSVLHEMLPSPHHIDVYRFEWARPRDEYGYVTGGMSDAIQPGESEFGQIELVFYAKAHSPLFPKLLHSFARYPWETGSSIGPGDTIPLGHHAGAVLGSDRFAALLFLPGVAAPETAIHDHPEFGISGTRLLTIVPITPSELDYKLTQGLQPLLNLLRDQKFDLAFSPDRLALV